MIIKTSTELESVLSIDKGSTESVYRIFVIDTKNDMLIQVRQYFESTAPVGVSSIYGEESANCQDIIDFANKHDWDNGNELPCVEYDANNSGVYHYPVKHEDVFGENNNEG